MTKIFIFSDPIETYTALHIVKFIVNFSIDKIIILKEYNYKGIINDFDFSIDYYNSIDECMFHSDLTIIFNKDSLPNRIILQIKKLCCKQNKKCYELLRNYNSKPEDYSKLNIDRTNENPSIAIISIGYATIPIKSELVINHIMSSVKANMQQIFSANSTSLIKQAQALFIMNPNININKTGGDVKILYFDLNNNITNFNLYREILYNLNLDYIVVLVDYDFKDYDLLSKYLQCFCSRNADIVIKSRWFPIGDDMFCHSDCFVDKSQLAVLDFEDMHLYDKIKFDLISKLSLGEGIKRIY